MTDGKRNHQGVYKAVLPEKLPGFISGNQVTLFENGETYFPAMEASFDRARHEIYLETYIYEDDATGQKIANALKRAARRAVNVYALIDDYGSRELPGTMLDDLRKGRCEDTYLSFQDLAMDPQAYASASIAPENSGGRPGNRFCRGDQHY